MATSSALRELAQRERARRRFYHYCRRVNPHYPDDAPHLRLLCRTLEQVERFVVTEGAEGIGRLMIFMPPRHWKSQTSSVLFPTWILGRNPDVPIIMASYAGDLAHKHSRQARNIILLDNEFSVLFGKKSDRKEPVSLSADSQAVQEWSIDRHIGGMRAAGVGGGITGSGCRILIIDDPHKDRKEAESKTIRDDIDDWFRSTAYTRVEGNGAIIIIMTRWHRDDEAGRLLKRMKEDPLADQWHVLKLPALATESDPLSRQPGEALWPEYQSVEKLHAIRANTLRYEFNSLFQQEPISPEDSVVNPAWFETVDHAPAGLRWMRYWDLAVSTKKRADFTASARGALSSDGYLYIADMVRGRWEWPDAHGQIVALAAMEPGVAIGVETNAFQLAAFQQLMREPALANREIRQVHSESDKLSRMLPWARRAKVGKVRLVRGPWIAAFLEEATDFPAGQNDDQVDVVSGITEMLANTGPAAGQIINEIDPAIYKNNPAERYGWRYGWRVPDDTSLFPKRKACLWQRRG